MDRDDAQALGALRFEVIDAIRAGDDALQRRSHETAHEVRARADEIVVGV